MSCTDEVTGCRILEPHEHGDMCDNYCEECYGNIEYDDYESDTYDCGCCLCCGCMCYYDDYNEEEEDYDDCG